MTKFVLISSSYDSPFLARNSVSNDAVASGRGISVEIPTRHIRYHNTQKKERKKKNVRLVLFPSSVCVLRDWISPFPFADEWRWKNGTFIFLYPLPPPHPRKRKEFPCHFPVGTDDAVDVVSHYWKSHHRRCRRRHQGECLCDERKWVGSRRRNEKKTTTRKLKRKGRKWVRSSYNGRQVFVEFRPTTTTMTKSLRPNYFPRCHFCWRCDWTTESLPDWRRSRSIRRRDPWPSESTSMCSSCCVRPSSPTRKSAGYYFMNLKLKWLGKCGREMGQTSYPFLCGLLLDRVQIPANVGGRTGSASGAFDRVGFAGRERLLRSTDGHPRWPHCQSNNKFLMKLIKSSWIYKTKYFDATQSNENDNLRHFQFKFDLLCVSPIIRMWEKMSKRCD